jgi:hypothetical protein
MATDFSKRTILFFSYGSNPMPIGSKIYFKNWPLLPVGIRTENPPIYQCIQRLPSNATQLSALFEQVVVLRNKIYDISRKENFGETRL